MRTRTTTAAALTAAFLFAATLTACGTTPDPDAKAAQPVQSDEASEITPEQRAAARKAAGLPDDPAPEARKAFLDGLNAIDPDIVHGKDDKAVSRGLTQCQTINSFPDDPAKQADQAKLRFTSPTHPEGRDQATAQKINELAHKHLCPDF